MPENAQDAQMAEQVRIGPLKLKMVAMDPIIVYPTRPDAVPAPVVQHGFCNVCYEVRHEYVNVKMVHKALELVAPWLCLVGT